MTETVTEAAGEAGRRVADDVVCYRCGYSLRGLDAGGLCPECGGSVDESDARRAAGLRGDVVPLAASDPRWLRRIALGCGMVFLGGVATTGVQGISQGDLAIPQTLRVVMFVATFVIPVAGAWIAAGREPVHAARRRAWLCILIRASLVCWMLAVLAVLAPLLSGSWAHVRRLFPIMGITAAVLSWSFFWNLRDIAARFDRRWPLRACGALAWLTLVTCLASVVPGLNEIETEPDSILMLTAQPIVAYPMLLVVLPRSLATIPRLDPLVAAHAGMTLVSLASLTALAMFHVAVRRSAKRSVALHRS